MRLVFAGTPGVSVPALEALLASDHDVVAVITRPDAQRGRGRQSGRSPIGALADQHGLPVLTPVRPSEPEFLRELQKLEPECCPVVAYGALLPTQALAIPAFGWLNLHFSLLPRWRGAAPVQHAVLSGDDTAGACVFRIEEGLDTGPIIDCVTSPILPNDTSGSLLDRLAGEGAGLLVRALDAVEARTATYSEQSNNGVTLAPKLTVEDARITWTGSAIEVDRHVRGVTPAPGAWTMAGPDRVKLGPVSVTDEHLCAPGEILVEKRQLRVGTATNDVLLSTVQAPGKTSMSAPDWARGVRDMVKEFH